MRARLVMSAIATALALVAMTSQAQKDKKKSALTPGWKPIFAAGKGPSAEWQQGDANTLTPPRDLTEGVEWDAKVPLDLKKGMCFRLYAFSGADNPGKPTLHTKGGKKTFDETMQPVTDPFEAVRGWLAYCPANDETVTLEWPHTTLDKPKRKEGITLLAYQMPKAEFEGAWAPPTATSDPAVRLRLHASRDAAVSAALAWPVERAAFLRDMPGKKAPPGLPNDMPVFVLHQDFPWLRGGQSQVLTVDGRVAWLPTYRLAKTKPKTPVCPKVNLGEIGISDLESGPAYGRLEDREFDAKWKKYEACAAPLLSNIDNDRWPKLDARVLGERKGRGEVKKLLKERKDKHLTCLRRAGLRPADDRLRAAIAHALGPHIAKSCQRFGANPPDVVEPEAEEGAVLKGPFHLPAPPAYK